MSRDQRKQIEQWLVENDQDLFASRVPLTALGDRAAAALGFRVSYQTARAVLWRLRFRGAIRWYNGQSDAVYALRGGRP